MLATSTTGYTTNLPLPTSPAARPGWSGRYDGQPLPRDHGGPVRLLVPHLYFWKSAKWVTRLTLLDHDQQGFWERNGYHDRRRPVARAALPGRLTVTGSPQASRRGAAGAPASVREVSHPDRTAVRAADRGAATGSTTCPASTTWSG